MNTNTNTPKPNLADIHASVARALHFALTNLRDMATMAMIDSATRGPKDKPLEIEVQVCDLSSLIGAFISAVALCVRHDALDQGAIESVWAEHLDEATTRGHSKWLDNITRHIGEMESSTNV